ncbi:MBL fold metallo-hydrolase [Baekduia sp.]|jgi:L-ascorbate metabolism protein UlaG (beta-lactamase superfamily)|uniref:MBL fold metallo-hydrolase n=1 Tax=Baekduia sp. TaxID=2600305 RepID=UPI002DFF1358|nr:MBL fold metallo-hydrolase [Baekduia sp.]
MQVEWYGQSAFRLSDGKDTIFIDPFDVAMFTARGMRWDYPAIAGVEAELLLVTHEHGDHNAIEVIGGDPAVLRSKAGTHESPIGEVIGIASEHDEVAGTQRGPNTIFAFTFGGRRIAHFGDFGQAALRPEQLAALGTVDLLFIPIGGGPTIGAEQATEIAVQLGAQIIVPMHYRTERIDFLEPVDDFAARAAQIERTDGPAFEVEAVAGDGPKVVVPAAP